MASMKPIDYDSPMRLLSLIIIILLTGPLAASEPATAYPLWDNHESVADYAKKVNLPPTKTLDLGNGVKLELVLIPAGKFMMGTPPPTPVDEVGFNQKIVTAQACLAASGGALLILLGFVLVQAIRRRRPQLSLSLLLLVTIATGGCVLSALHWQHTVNGLRAAQQNNAVATVQFLIANDDEKPAHAVTLKQPFYMGMYDVTQEQYQSVIGTNRSQYKGKDNPVEMVSWYEAQVFCKKLTEKTKQAIRLPTEAEWEYSCRAGTTTTYNSGDTEADLSRVAWYAGNSNNTTRPVGLKEANAFGLYDMHGNVWQWCQDWYGDRYYSKSPAENPKGPDQGDSRLLRGGSWLDVPMRCRSAIRFDVLDDNGSFIGFRVVITLP